MSNSNHTAGCIDPPTLARYLSGLAGIEESNVVARHLSDCERCVQECESLATAPDSFVAILREMRDVQPRELTPDCAAMIARIGQSTSLPHAPPVADPLPAGDVDTLLMADMSTEPDQSTNGFAPPLDFGRYTIQRRLGTGGMAAVYQAFDQRLNRQVALKLPHRAIQSDPLARARFQQEGHAAAAVTHPHVCGVLDIGEHQGLCYLTMPLLEGISLADRLRMKPPLELSAVLRIVCDLCEAVAAVHAGGVIHRDIKPSNVFLTNDGRTMLMDFGIALATDGRDRLTRDGLLMGTPAYFSPEQAAGDWDRVGPAVDVYAVGVVLYELLSGTPPFIGPTGIIIGKILHETPPPLVSQYPDCDDRLIDICRRAMSKQPEGRFANATALREALQAWQAPTTATSAAWCGPIRQRRTIAIACLAVVVLFAVLAIKFRTKWGTWEVTYNSEPAAPATKPQTPPNKVATPTAPRRNPLEGLDPSAIPQADRDALREMSTLPEGVRWLASLAPSRLLDSGQPGKPLGKLLVVSLSRDGGTLAVLHAGPLAAVWNLSTLTRTSLKPLPPHDTTLTLSPDAGLLLTSGGGWRVRVWDVIKFQETAALTGHSNWINTLTVDRECRFAASSSKDGTVRCWDIKRGVNLWTGSQGGWARSAAISETGKRVVSGGNNGSVKIWDAMTGKEQSRFQASKKGIIDIQLAGSDGSISTLDLEGSLAVWEPAGQRQRWQVATRPGHAVRFTADGKWLACTGTNGELTILDTVTGQPRLTLPVPPPEFAWQIIGFSADGRQVVIRRYDDYIGILQLPKTE